MPRAGVICQGRGGGKGGRRALQQREVLSPKLLPGGSGNSFASSTSSTSYRIAPRMRLAIDTGGTFTDCIYVRDAALEILKVPSTPHRPADAIAAVLEKIFPGMPHDAPLRAKKRGPREAVPLLDLTCGTTVGTNALLERRGGRVALVTTAGFEDVLEIGRQARPRLYDLLVKKAEPLVPQSRRFGLAERLDSEGRVLLSPSRQEIARVVRAVARSGAEPGAGSTWSPPESVAVCLLFSFVNPAHEKAIA